MAEVIPYRFRLRGGTAAEWTAANPVLMAREPGIETDTPAIKIGDGVTAWNDLPYSAKNVTDVLAEANAAATQAAGDAEAGAVSTANAYTDGKVLTPNRGRILPASYPGGINTVTTAGHYEVWSSADATTLGLPYGSAGNLEVWSLGTYVYQTFHVVLSGGSHLYARFSTDGGTAWGTWFKFQDAALAQTEANAYADSIRYDRTGNYSAAATGSDLNTMLTPGQYSIAGVTPNTPAYGHIGSLTVQKTSDAVAQTFLSWTTGELSFRVMNTDGTVKNNWARLATKAELDAQKWRNDQNIGTGSMDTMTTPGVYSIASSNVGGSPNPSVGTLEVLKANITLFQRYTSWISGTTSEPRVFLRKFETNLTPGPWFELPSKGLTDGLLTRVGALESSPAIRSGYKVVPAAYTLPGATMTQTVAEGSVRWARKFRTAPRRVRVHVTNANPFGSNGSALTSVEIRLGRGDTSGGLTNQVVALSGATIPAAGAELVTPWTYVSVGDGEHLGVSIGWNGDATTTQQLNYGGGWVHSARASNSNTTGTNWTFSKTTPFYVWIEAEIPADVPVIAGLGDSITVGTGAAVPVEESWLSMYAYDRGNWPVHMAQSGSSHNHWTADTDARWAKLYPGINLPKIVDAVINQLGRNDFTDTATFAEVQAEANALVPVVAKRLGGPMYYGTITPYHAEGSTKLAARTEYNNWIRTVPNGVRGVFDQAAAIGTADGTAIATEFNGDGLHPSTAGNRKMADTILAATPSPRNPSLRATDRGGPELEHDFRLMDMRERLGAVNVVAPKAVTIIMDHGLVNFRDKVWPLLQARNLPVTLAINSKGWDSTQNSGVTYADVQGWVNTGLVEAANHGRNHTLNGDYEHDRQEIIGGREELEAQLGVTIDSWIQTGGTAYPFADGDALHKYWSTTTGPLAYRSHAVGTGLLPNTEVYYDLNGHPVFGCKGGWIDRSTGSIQTIINNTPVGKGYIVRFHPQFLDTVDGSGNAYLTTAGLTSFLDYLVTERDAGRLQVLTFNRWQIARHAPEAGDTGLRSVTSLFGGTPTGGNILIRRVGYEVELNIYGVSFASIPSSFWTLPVGFRPDHHRLFAASSYTASGARFIISQSAGTIQLISGVTGTAYYVVLRWQTRDPFPSVYPGTSA